MKSLILVFVIVLFSFPIVVDCKDGLECGIVSQSSISESNVFMKCEIVIQELENLEEKTPEEIEKKLDEICELLKIFKSFETKCEAFVHRIYEFVKKMPHLDPNKICEFVGLCEKCALFPDGNENPPNEEKVSRLMAIILGTLAFFFMKDDSIVNKAWVDLDKDGFDELSSDFRGRDCDDHNPDVHPGLRIEKNVEIDDNCNGIYGWYKESEKKSYEDLFCNEPLGPENRNLLTFGDSVCVGFSIEEKWLDLNDISTFIKKALLTMFSFPELSITTGYQTNHSLYQMIVSRNKCAHRQFENLCVSGGVMGDLVEQVKTAQIPEEKEDMKPAMVYLGYIGNDVCKDTLEQIAPPDVFRKQLLDGLELLNEKLPKDSRVLLIGFSNGMQYELMNNQTHPLSTPTNKITYSEFYDFLTCSGLNVCSTWLTSNEELRQKTTAKAHELDLVIKDVAENKKYENFEMRYVDIDQVIKGGVENMVAQGIPKYKFFNQIDGFHPSLEYGHPHGAIEFEKIVEERFPGFLGKVNPHNADIQHMFGDQGGY